jgi:acyl transferase domain-containing protein/NADPH:quinone reductase-like Zn-dependent oxidoreductase/thioesterase domain-containing protein/acyl carrier protein
MNGLATNPPVAIVGIGCRFPGGGNDPESFWRLLVEGRNAIREVPPNRWSLERYYHPDPSTVGTMTTKWGGFVDELDAFDAHFWSVSPREAMRMDPQQRWLLEVAWEAIEDGGMAPSRLRGEKVGVFVGISANDYGGLQLPNLDAVDAYTNSGSTLSIASNRISYMLDLKGPSMSVDTACSSGAVAVWLACQSIGAGQCVAALVGGVNAVITPHATVGFSKAAMISRTGQCFAFDARANGYVRAEGAGVVYLKPLASALADGDRIYAVIRGAAVNQDGHTSSMTVPSVDGQAAMLRQAYQQAGIAPGRAVYVEAHGTGTPVGDPIEATALGRVLREARPAGSTCLIGSVKTNIGHLEAGSGIAGLIKAALVLHHRMIPPSLNYETPNPNIPFDALGLAVATHLQSLGALDGGPPVVGVNSFGFGGTNAHIVLEAAPSTALPTPVMDAPAQRPCVLPISARDDEALGRSVDAYRELLGEASHGLSDVCAAAGERREHHAHRLVVIGQSAADMCTRLITWRRDGKAAGVVSGRTAAHGPLVFVFTGQGSQWPGMGRELLAREPVVRRTLEEIDACLAPLMGWSLIAEMMRPAAESRIDHTDVAQPSIFALQVALVQLWKSWGVAPAMVVGHSVGEVAAAYAADVYDLADAVRIIFHRSRLMHTRFDSGRMVAVALSPDEARRAIDTEADAVEVAAINSPHLVTLSGEAGALERITARLERAGVFTRRLKIHYAFHSRHMDPIRDHLVQALADIEPRASTVPFVSTVTGMVLDGKWLDAHYWWDNVRRAVLFGPAVCALVRARDHTFLEIGPHPALESSLQACLSDHGRAGAVLHSLRRDTDESSEMMTAVASLHVIGAPIDWRALNQSHAPRVRLPRYPWGRESFWLESRAAARDRLAAFAHPLLGQRVDGALPTWQRTLDPRRLSYLSDHRIWDSVVFPASGYAEMGLALGRLLFPREPHAVEDLEISRALFVDEASPPTIQVVFDPDDKSFGVYSSTTGHDAWELHARGTLRRVASGAPSCLDVDALRARLDDRFDHEQYYHELAIRGYQFGPSFQHIQCVWRVPGEALALIEAAESTRTDDHAFHPTLLDACLQAVLGTQVAAADARPEDDLFLPESVRRIHLYAERPPARLWAHARLTATDTTARLADIAVYDERGDRVADILGARLVRADRTRVTSDLDDCWYRFEWEPATHADAVQAAAGSRSDGASPVVTKRYVLFADEQGVAEALAKRLDALGHRTVVVRRSSGLAREDAAVTDDDIAGVVHCWSLDHPRAGGMDLEAVRRAQHSGAMSAFRLLRALAHRATPVWFVTRDVHRVVPSDRADGLASSPLTGLVRVANNEREGRVSLVDLDGCPSDEASEHLAAEVTLAGDGEIETAYRGSTRYALRLRSARLDQVPKRLAEAVRQDGAVTPYRLQTDKPGVLTNLALHETERLAPGPDEIEIRVHAGGINFRDVMKALGTYPGRPIDALWLGDDVSGVVERVGERVQTVRPGDRVAGVAPYAFGAYAITDPRMVLRMPSHMSFAEAATLPTVFLTAHYALQHLGRMQPGERVLIHAATGGVGQAAIQIARHLGLEIFATAGTPDKRRLLGEMGVRHVMDSRSLRFADEVMDITGGRGVDAVLNSLAGDFVPKSLAVLAPFGRFIEIGKIDIYRNSKLGLRPLRNNISYFVVDLVQHMQAKPAFVAQMLAELAERFEAGDYRPLPSTVFSITQAAEAFRFMAQGKHVGKNVLRFDVDHIPVGPCTQPTHRFRADASYLVTGGAGGVGLEVAKWLARCGARHLVLMSRTGPRDELAHGDIESLRASGVTVIDARGDVTRRADVESALKQVAACGLPLRGVFHAAMLLDDDSLAALDERRVERVMEPKMAGAWNLHLATRDRELDHFVCFSSFSAVCGAPRQSSYNAGNAFLDALAHYRRSAGLPALTVDWGAIAGAGFVERNAKTAEYLSRVGVKPFQITEALEIFGRVLLLDPVQIVAARVDWRALAGLIPLVDSCNTYASVACDRHAADEGRSLSARLIAAGVEIRIRLVEEFIVAQVGEVVGLPDTKVDRTAPLTSLGLDSLMTVELVNRMESVAGIRMPMATLFSGPSIAQLAQTVLKLLVTTPGSAAGATDPAPAPVAADDASTALRDPGHVVAIRTAGDRSPLIIFHPVGGSVAVYAGLARQLPADLPLYGIESRLMRGAERELGDVDAMVSAYVVAVRDVAPPPYRLFGFSLGGYLAARVAEALERDAVAVDLVGVVEWDVRPQLTPRAQADALLRLSMASYRYLEREIGAVRSLTDSRLRQELGSLMDEIVREGPQGSDLVLRWSVDRGLIVGATMHSWAQQYLACFGQHLAMLAPGLPLPRFHAPLAIWRASDGFGSPLDSWQHAGAAAIEHVADGDHFAFLRPPGVFVLAKQLDEILCWTPRAARTGASRGP